jgi:ribonuclease P protein component
MLSKQNRLTGTANFNEIFNKGEKIFSPFFVVYRLKLSQNIPAQFGIITSKKVGGAVVRNHIRRLISEAIRNILKSKACTYNYIFIAKKEVNECSLDTITNEINKIWE